MLRYTNKLNNITNMFTKINYKLDIFNSLIETSQATCLIN